MNATQRDRPTPSMLLQTVETVPEKPGVYLFFDAQRKLLYVGKARNLRTRVRSYFHASQNHPRIARMVRRIHDVEVIVTATEGEALLLENSLIKNEKPRFNVLLRDDKTYPYLKITRERFPRVILTRRRERDDRARFFGPFPSAKAARRTIRLLHQHFKVRQCTLDLDRKSCAPCLQFHIKRCDAPCAGLVSEATYGQGIRRAELFLAGKTDALIRQVSDEMVEATKALAFEKAAYLRDLIVQLRGMQRTQTVANLPFDKVDVVGIAGDAQRGCIVILTIRNRALVHSAGFTVDWEESMEEDAVRLICHYVLDHQDPPNQLLVPRPESFRPLQRVLAQRDGRQLTVKCPKRGAGVQLLHMAEENAQTHFKMAVENGGQPHAGLAQLAEALGLDRPPRHIECFDISHTQGTLTVASMVHFENGKPDKKKYRRFNIKTVDGIDDVASMHEVVHRRVRRLLNSAARLPDLIVVDGGIGQLHAARQALEELGLPHQPIIGLAKREEMIFLPDRGDPVKLPKNHPGLRLLQHARDEAHRFGISFHRQKRSKAMLRSEMDRIPGVGPTRTQKLLRHFGSIKGIRAASLDQLIRAVGPKTGRRVFDYFRHGGR